MLLIIYALGSIFYQSIYDCVPINTVIYVSSLLYLCILIVILCIFIVPAGTPRQPRMKFFCAYSSVVGQVPG